MELTDAHHALIANARRAFAADFRYAEEIAWAARTTPRPKPEPKAPRPKAEPKPAREQVSEEERRRRKNEWRRKHRAAMTPERKAADSASSRAWKRANTEHQRDYMRAYRERKRVV